MFCVFDARPGEADGHVMLMSEIVTCRCGQDVQEPTGQLEGGLEGREAPQEDEQDQAVNEEGHPAGREVRAPVQGGGWGQSTSWGPRGCDVMLRVVGRGGRDRPGQSMEDPCPPREGISGLRQQHVH